MRFVELIVSVLILFTAQTGFLLTVNQSKVAHQVFNSESKILASKKQALERIEQQITTKGKSPNCKVLEETILCRRYHCNLTSINQEQKFLNICIPSN